METVICGNGSRLSEHMLTNAGGDIEIRKVVGFNPLKVLFGTVKIGVRVGGVEHTTDIADFALDLYQYYIGQRLATALNSLGLPHTFSCTWNTSVYAFQMYTSGGAYELIADPILVHLFGLVNDAVLTTTPAIMGYPTFGDIVISYAGDVQADTLLKSPNGLVGILISCLTGETFTSERKGTSIPYAKRNTVQLGISTCDTFIPIDESQQVPFTVYYNVST